MNLTLVSRPAVLERLIDQRPGLEVWIVHIEGQEAQAIVYPDFVGKVMPGDRVMLNTTAMDLQLGTGGQHIAISRAELGGPVPPPELSREDGHIIKLRYTPLQFRVMAAEEQASPYHEALRMVDRLPGTPVVCLGLHSQLAPVAGGIKDANPNLRIAYIMTDSGALPLPYSQLVERLKIAGLLDVTITAGQAYGGDLEAVNIYSAMVTAVVVGRAQVIIVGQGPGNVGTDTPLGFGGIEQAILLNAAASLDGRPVAVPRISFADTRQRHQGLSHHTMTVLKRLVLADVTLPLPTTVPVRSQAIIDQLRREEITRHRVVTADGSGGIRYCQQAGIPLQSMGRRYDADPEFFLAAAAAGRVAAEMVLETG